MSYEVIARKWRPQQFSDVVGQDHVSRTLENAITSGRVAHAYLFVGPRGIGKTTMARIFAKAMNCEKGPTPNPCDQCSSCLEIMAGNSLDVIEIDGASNRGIDHIRDLRDNVRYTPARDRYKIYIIDEVHMLTTESFNALLKTLEEPPAHVKFEFATTEPQRVPATILSRCQRFDLRAIAPADIVGRLREIADAEGITVDDEALLAIARAAEGGLRDAESAMDQLISFRGKELKETDVLDVFGLVARQTLVAMASAILEGDVPSAIRQVNELESAGKDMQRVVVELLDHFRNVLVFQYAGDDAEQQDLFTGDLDILRKHADYADAEKLLRVINILAETDRNLRYALSRRTVLEVALIRCARAATTVSVDEVLRKLEVLKASLANGVQIKSGDSAAASESALRDPGTPYKPPSEKKASPRTSSTAPADYEAEREMLSSKWQEILDRVGKAAMEARSCLVDAKPTQVLGDRVIVSFDPEFAAEKDKMKYPRNRKALQNVFTDLLRRDVGCEFAVLQHKAELPADHSPEKQPKAARNSKGTRRNMTQQARQKWTQDEKVRQALETFGGDIVDIRE